MTDHDDPRHHPWWRHVPSAEQTRALRQRRRRRIWNRLTSRKGLFSLLMLVNGGILITMAAAGAGPIALLALLPLVLMPALAGLAWWLTWQEFHH